MFSLRPHIIEKVPGTDYFKIVKTNDYLRITKAEEILLPDGRRRYKLVGVVYLQSGKLYTEGGIELKHPPPWIDEEIAKIPKQALAAVGWFENPKKKVTKGRPRKYPIEALSGESDGNTP